MFFKDILTNKATTFRIGDLIISAQSNSEIMNEPVNIPGSFMAFEGKYSDEPDISFVYDCSADIKRGKAVFQSDNYMNLEIYESGQDAWEWLGLADETHAKIEMRVTKDFSQILLKKMDASPKLIMRELGIVFDYALLARGACMLHGIIMEYEGRGILILARSGVGKSTHARMWRDQENALIINGDRCLLRKKDSKWYAYGSPWCGTSGEYINRKVAVTDIVFLDRGLTNQVVRMSVFEGYMRLLESIKAPNWNQELYLKAIDRCEELSNEISMWHLACTPDIEAVQVLKEAIFKGVETV